MKNTRKIAGFIAATAAAAMLVTSSASAEDRHRDGTSRDNTTYRDDSTHQRDSNNRRNESRNNNSYRDNSTHQRDGNNYRNESRNNNSYRDNSTHQRDGGNYRNESRNNNSYRDNGSYRHEDNNRRFESRNSNHFSEHGRIQRFERERDGYRVWIGGARYPYWVPFSRLGGHRLAIGLDIRLGGIFNGTYIDVDALGWPGDPYYNDPYYNGGGYYDRYDGYLSGRVERVDFRYGTMLLRDDRSGRVVEVDMRGTARDRGLDFGDVRPGDRVTLTGSWDGGYFRAYRIDGVRQY